MDITLPALRRLSHSLFPNAYLILDANFLGLFIILKLELEYVLFFM